MPSLCRISTVVVLTAFLAHVGMSVFDGAFTPNVNVCPDPLAETCCTVVTHPDLVARKRSTEDLVVLHDLDVALFIGSDFQGALVMHNFTSGSMWSYNLESRQVQQVELVFDNIDPSNFLPHGLSYLQDPASGTRYLFMVLHSPTGDHVGRFEVHVKDATVVLKETGLYASPLFVSLNDLVAVSPKRFFVTNDHGSRIPQSTLEDLFGLARASVVAYDVDAEQAKYVAKNIAYANGINVSPDGKTLYVAELLAKQVLVYTIGQDGFSASLRGSTFMDSNVDNIDVDPATGDLWIGSHISIFHFLRHTINPDRFHAPSQVIHAPVDAKGDIKHHRTVFMSDGSDLSASSVGVYVPKQKRLLVGAVFNSKILDCAFAPRG